MRPPATRLPLLGLPPTSTYSPPLTPLRSVYAMDMATFLDLPNELLETILDYAKAPLPTLFELALSCTGLHHVCLQMHLKRSGILNPEELCNVIIPATKQEDDAIAALCLAKWITKTKRMECHFQAWNGDLKAMLFQLSQVDSFVRSLTHIGEVVLEFDPQDNPYTLYADLYDKDIVAWSDAMGKLLNSIVERGCHTLEIHGLTQLHDVYTCSPVFSNDASQPIASGLGLLKLGPHQMAERDPVGTLEGVLSGQTWRYKRNSRILYLGSFSEDSILTYPSPFACANSKLTSFTIGSKSLLCPPLLQWTYSILACSPIRTLTLSKTAVLQSSGSPVTTLLPMACPALKRLVLFSPGAISHSDVTTMACAFPQLEYLSIEGLDMNLCIYPQSEPTLRLSKHLAEIRVQLDWLRPSYSFDAKAFPALKILTIICREEGTINMSTPHLALWNLGANVPRSLNLEIVAGSNITWWMDSEYYIISEKRPGVTLDGYRHVTGLIMTLKFDIMCSTRPADIPKTRGIVEKWFAHFPALKKVNIEAKVKNPQMQVPAIEKFYHHAMPRVIQRLDTLEVNGVAVDINQILKDTS